MEDKKPKTMTFKDYFNNLKTHQKTIVVIIGLVVVLSLILTLIQPFEYRSSSQLLIIQKHNPNLDAYTASRSAERLSKNLSNVIYTSSFFEKVMNSGFDLKDKFSKNEAKRRSQWKRKVVAQVSMETGMLRISVYDRDKVQAKEFTQAIAHVLSTKGEEYHGGGEDVEIKLVDAPLASRFPVRPNLALNLFTGLILGVVAGGGYLMTNSKSQIPNLKSQIPNDKQEKNYELGIRNQEDRFKIQNPRFKNGDSKDQQKSEMWDKIVNPTSPILPISPTFLRSQVLETGKIYTMYDHLGR